MASAVTKPDFAYPATVTKNAEKALKSALTAGDGQAIVRSLADIGLSQAAIGADKLPSVVKRIEEIKAHENDATTRSLLALLLVDAYSDVYFSDKWNFDNRQLPMTPLPASYDEWSGAQFRARIDSLCSEALAPAELLHQKPLADYKSIINVNKRTLEYYPTLYDFVAQYTIDKRRMLSQFSNQFSMIYLTPARIFESMIMFVPSSPVATSVLRTYAQWLKFNHGNTAPTINIELQRIDAISGGIYNGTEGVEKRKSELLKQLYEQYSNSEYSGDILSDMNYGDTPQERSAMAAMLKKQIAAFPAYAGIGCLKNRLDDILRRQIMVETEAFIAPGRDFKIKLSGWNAPEVVVDFYTIKPERRTDNYFNLKRSNGSMKPVKSVAIRFAGAEAPFACDTTVTTSLPKEGYYIAVPRIPGNTTTNRGDYRIIRSSRLFIAGETYDNDALFVAIDPLTGVPVKDATISRINNSRKAKIAIAPIGKTSADGFLNTTISEYGVYSVEKAGDIYAMPINISPNRLNHDVDSAVNVVTDLSLYHPGDTLRWAAVAYSFTGKSHSPLANSKLKITLRMANGEQVFEDYETTDDWGRVTGGISIPTGGLTGYATLTVEGNKFRGRTTAMISDYKLPTFVVKANTVEQNTPAKGDVTLTGDAITFSGMPVSDAKATLSLSVAQHSWWRRGNKIEFYSAEATTDAGGNWKFEIPAEVMACGPAPSGLYTARVTVTSSAGESRQCSREFTIAASYSIVATIPASIDVTRPINLNVAIENNRGERVSRNIRWHLRTNVDTIASGKLNTSNPIVDWSKVKGGSYRLTLSLASPDGDCPDYNCDVIVYRPSDKYSPVENVVWSPTNRLTVTEDNSELLFAVAKDATMVLYTLIDKESTRILERRWIKCSAGFHTLKVKLDTDCQDAKINLMSMHNYAIDMVNVDVTRRNPERTLILKASAFRDKIEPGAEEIWTLKAMNADSIGMKSAVMLDMWNYAIASVNGLSVKPFRLDIASRGFWLQGWSYSLPGTTYSYLSSDHDSSYICNILAHPTLEYYGRSFSPRMRVMTVNESKLYGAGAPRMMMKMASRATSDHAAVKEDAVEEEAADVDTGGTNNESGITGVENAQPAFEYRTGENALAFFEPMLTTDDNGVLNYRFRVPNANTTWSFNALAYNRNIAASSVSLLTTASKPVMVQPNLPRFVRNGDSVVVKSMVMNRTEARQRIATRSEAFNPLTGATISSADTIIDVEANSSGVATLSFEVPMNTSAIGFRVKSSTEEFADGEQNVIAALPFTTPVIETLPFYMAEDSTDMELPLPKMTDNANVTLEFCSNPIWYVVTALPGLADTKPTTAPDAAASIFSAAVAEGLMREHPEIADAIRYWIMSDKSDSTLVSMLERNADLKTVLLDATPWMRDAQSDTERMSRLALLLDKRQIAATYDKSIELLEKLQRHDGGWAWMNSFEESSEWATENVLQMLGRLNTMKYLPGDKRLVKMLPPALSFIEKATIKRWHKYPRHNYTSYVVLRDKFPEYKQSAESLRLTVATVQKVVAQWKKADISTKATYALLLDAHGYSAVARQILRSMDEYASVSPTSGMWWQSVGDAMSGSIAELSVAANALEAYHKLRPQSSDAARIRQWLILQKETRNWGSSTTASSVIASMLSTLDTTMQPATMPKITISGRPLVLTPMDAMTGYVKADISDMNPSGAVLRIADAVAGHAPARGAVYCQYTDRITSVKPSDCEALKIEKTLYKQSGSEWVEATDLRVGDRVKVILTVKASRALQYVTIIDNRSAALEPVEQLPTPIYSEGICFYRENRDSYTTMHVSNMPKGTYLLGYELWVNNSGEFTSGIATAQSQYAPQISAHSGGSMMVVR